MYWTDADGRLLGTSADFGDEEGGNGDAAIERPCKPSGSGVTALDHTWKKPGTYNVKLELMTYNCRDFRSETVTTTVHIEVSPASSPSSSEPPSAEVG
jgi:PKD repeat protein